VSGARPTLFATSETARELGTARAAALLVGGYDGSGNYGDIALVEAALDLAGRAGPGLLAVPVLERSALEDHREMVAAGGRALPHAVFFDPAGTLAGDDLAPVPAPADLAFGACYLYGGGYLNSAWGERKLAMLRAAESLLEAGGAEPFRLGSGLQVEPSWVAGPAAGSLRSFAFLGVRDDGSAEALGALGPGGPEVANTGDDATALLDRAVAGGGAPEGGPLRVNLHFAEHEWTGESAGAALAFYAGFLAELKVLAGRPLLAQPLLAYLDRRIDERPAQARLREACAGIGVELAEPLLLRPAALDDLAPRLGEADLTLSCSYHVALTALMLGVPALLLAGNAYYAQKAAGLAADFGLPRAHTPGPGTNPAEIAAEIAPELLDPDRAAVSRERLLARAESLRQRRLGAELELLSRLGAAAVTALGERVEELAGRLRERSGEPAALHAEIAALRTELEELRGVAAESPLDAELRVQEAETRAAAAHERLAELLGSRSWRLGEPLRRAGARLRRR
jgi:Polysaccharide pyruvyl transferase